MSSSGNGPVAPESNDVAELPATMGIVLDPAGAPIANALVSGKEMTTSEGVFSGNLNGNSSGWVAVEALGYLDGYTRSYGAIKGVEMYSTRLTPLQTGVIFNEPSPATITLILNTGFELQFDVSRDHFSAPVRAVEAAAVNPIDIGPFFEDLDTGAELEIVSAFGVISYNEVLDRIPLAQGSPLAISILDGGSLSDSALIAVFDPEKGIWITQQPACQREGLDMLSCSLEMVSPLVAIFDSPTSTVFDQPPPMAFQTRSLLGASFTSFVGVMSEQRWGMPLQDAVNDYKNAERAYDEYIDEHGEVDPNDPEGGKVLNDLIDSARSLAQENGGEAGKFGLIKAASAAYESGDQATGDQLSSEAADLANKLAKKDLEESDCGQYNKLLKRAQQLELVAGDQSLEQQLLDKVKEMVVDCDVWRGSITVWMISSSSHPGGLDMQAKGAPSWYERHNVELWTNVETYQLHGTDTIQLSFPEITYVKEDECRNDIKISGEPTGGQVKLSYTGRHDGYEFQINEPPGVNGSVSIAQKHHFETKENDICNVITDMQLSAPNYASVIVHGFEYGSPPITLQEMLSEGSQGTYGEVTTIRGSQDINNPDPDTGKYPFFFGAINWSISHVQPKLPIEE